MSIDLLNKSQNIKIIVHLLRFNFQWHAHILKDILFRYKIFIIFIALLVSPTIYSLVTLVSSPLKAIFSDSMASNLSIGLSLIGYQLASLSWVILHKVFFAKSSWGKYLSSLNITFWQKIIIDTVALLMINVVLFLPLVITFVLALVHTQGIKFEYSLLFSKLFFTVTTLLLLQSLFLNKKYKSMFNLIILDGLFLLVEEQVNHALQAALILVLAGVAVILMIFSYRNHVAKVKKVVCKFDKIKLVNIEQSFSFHKIQIKNIIGNVSQLTMLTLILIFTNAFFMYFIITGGSDQHFQLLISLAMLMNALILCNLFRWLDEQWSSYSFYVMSLPITTAKLFFNQFLILTAPVLILNIFIFSIDEILNSGQSYYKNIYSILISILFLIVSYYPQIRFKRYGFFVSLLLSVAFFYINFLIVS